MSFEKKFFPYPYSHFEGGEERKKESESNEVRGFYTAIAKVIKEGFERNLGVEKGLDFHSWRELPRLIEMLKSSSSVDISSHIFREALSDENLVRERIANFEARRMREIESTLMKKGKDPSEYALELKGKMDARMGEKAEELFLGLGMKYFEKVIILPTTRYDDVMNGFNIGGKSIGGVDFYGIDCESGKPFFAIDVGAYNLGEEQAKEKREKVFQLNCQGGARLKYGVELVHSKENFEKRKSEKRIKIEKQSGLPVFWIFLPPSVVNKCEREFKGNLNESSNVERETFFNYIFLPLIYQTGGKVEEEMIKLIEPKSEQENEKVTQFLNFIRGKYPPLSRLLPTQKIFRPEDPKANFLKNYEILNQWLLKMLQRNTDFVKEALENQLLGFLKASK